jgi:hypothetical protein
MVWIYLKLLHRMWVFGKRSFENSPVHRLRFSLIHVKSCEKLDLGFRGRGKSS